MERGSTTGLPLVLFLRPTFWARDAMATGLFSAIALSLIVALTQIAVDSEIIALAEAAPLVGAGVVAALFFFRIASMRRGRSAPSEVRDRL